MAAREAIAAWLETGDVDVGGDADIGIHGTEPGSTSDVSGLTVRVGETVHHLELILTLQDDGSWKLTRIEWSGAG